jgi:hypothetical protein
MEAEFRGAVEKVLSLYPAQATQQPLEQGRKRVWLAKKIRNALMKLMRISGYLESHHDRVGTRYKYLTMSCCFVRYATVRVKRSCCVSHNATDA